MTRPQTGRGQAPPAGGRADAGAGLTLSRLPVKPVYTAADLDALDLESELGVPGAYPFTRGIVAGGYAERPWVMGQYSGYASPADTNRRIRNLIAQGQKGFSIALDLPTQIGLDSDHAMARGEVGKVGVPIDTVEDVKELLQGIRLDEIRQIRTTANAIGPLAAALFIVAAEELGASAKQFRVMFQNDVLKEYVARGTYIFPPRAGLRFSVDVVEYCARELPHWEPIEFCGYHIRDAGSDAVQEVAFAMANGFEYIDAALARGLGIDDIGHALWLFLSAHLDIFEEVAKFRAARRVWAQIMRDRYGASDEHCKLNLFVYTLGSPQTRAEPLNNIVRVAYQALAAVLGGVQTLATTAYDEAYQLPSDEAVRVSLRTQQILAHETGVARSVDPLAGSYLIEDQTNRLESAIRGKLDEVAAVGGALRALETGWIAREIDEEAYRQQKEVEAGDRIVVGVNRFQSGDETAMRGGLASNDAVETGQVRRLEAIRGSRDSGRVNEALAGLVRVATGSDNTIPALIDCVRARATVGEMMGALRGVWGEYQP